MTADDFVLAGDFDPVTRQDWLDEAERLLGGRSVESLATTTVGGLRIEPLYDEDPPGLSTGAPGAFPYVRGGSAAGAVGNGWDIRVEHADPDPEFTNQALLADLEGGATSVVLRIDRAGRLGQDADQAVGGVGVDGLSITTVDDLDEVLADVRMDMATVVLAAGAAAPAAAHLMGELVVRRGLDPPSARVELGWDPIGALADAGSLPAGVEQALASVGDLARWATGELPGARAVAVDTAAAHGAGASDVDELAWALSTGVAYLRAMEAAGLSVDAAANQIRFTLQVDADQFAGTAKLRAFRWLWGRVLDACEAQHSRPLVHARTAARMFTRRDPWVNMLRSTVACFAAAVGGADGITVLPFSARVGPADELSRRVARNTQVVLSEESGLGRVIDAGGGSWYLEHRTTDLARSAWDRFREIEAGGGIVAALLDGSMFGALAETRRSRQTDIDRRKTALTGVTEFPDLDEKPVTVRSMEPTIAEAAAERVASARAADPDLVTLSGLMSSSGEPTVIEPLPAWSLADGFEALRDRSDRHLQATGRRPSVFLASLGPPAEHNARAGFARGFFGSGGVAVVGDSWFDSADALAAAFGSSQATEAVLCSSDRVYGTHAEAAARALREAGARWVYMAGRPGDNERAYREAGIDEFIAIGTDVRATLAEAHSRMGVTE